MRIKQRAKHFFKRNRRLELSGWRSPAQSPAGSQPGKTWKSVFLNVNSQPEENYLKRFERAASTKTHHHWHLLMDMNRESTIVFCHLEFLRFFPSQDLHLSQVSLNHQYISLFLCIFTLIVERPDTPQLAQYLCSVLSKIVGSYLLLVRKRRRIPGKEFLLSCWTTWWERNNFTWDWYECTWWEW